MRLARGGTSDESASRSLMRGKFPSTLPAPARERPSRLAAKARAAAMDNTADQRSARAEVQAAREGAGTARARQRTSTKVDASELHRPPTSMPRTVRWHRREAASSGYARSLARRATWRAAPAVRPRMRRGAPADVSGATSVVSTATCAPFQR